MGKSWFVAGAVYAGLGVVAGAFGAHGLEGRLRETGHAEAYETAVRYEMYHGLAILAVALTAPVQPAVGRRPLGTLTAAAWLFAAGIVLFSGSLYVYSLTDAGWLAAIAPLGGIALIGGWLFYAIGAAAMVRRRS